MADDQEWKPPPMKGGNPAGPWKAIGDLVYGDYMANKQFNESYDQQNAEAEKDIQRESLDSQPTPSFIQKMEGQAQPEVDLEPQMPAIDVNDLPDA